MLEGIRSFRKETRLSVQIPATSRAMDIEKQDRIRKMERKIPPPFSNSPKGLSNAKAPKIKSCNQVKPIHLLMISSVCGHLLPDVCRYVYKNYGNMWFVQKL